MHQPHVFRAPDWARSGELVLAISDKEGLEGRKPFVVELSVGDDGNEGKEEFDRVGDGNDNTSACVAEDDSLRRNSTHI